MNWRPDTQMRLCNIIYSEMSKRKVYYKAFSRFHKTDPNIKLSQLYMVLTNGRLCKFIAYQFDHFPCPKMYEKSRYKPE